MGESSMTHLQYRAALKNLNLTIVGAGPVFGLSHRQAQRLAAGDSKIPKLISQVIGLLLDRKLKLEDLE